MIVFMAVRGRSVSRSTSRFEQSSTRVHSHGRQ
jgi:hypothetical protein